MDGRFPQSRVFLTALLLVAASAACHAASYTQTVSYVPTQTDWTNSLGPLSKFNPALGTLTKVEWQLDSGIDATHRFENFSASSETITSVIDAWVGFSDPGDSLLHQVHPSDTYSDTVTADDTVWDWGGSAGRTLNRVTGDVSSQWDSTGKPGSYLSWYTGLGTFSISVGADGNGLGSGSGDMAYQYLCLADAHARITYTYDQIPEPATGTLMLFGLAGLAVIRRRKAS